MTFRILLACLFTGGPARLAADQVEFTDGGTLSGEVLGINELERVLLQPAIADQPVEIHSGAVRKIRFSSPAPESAAHQAVLTLANGDIIPCDVLAIGEESLSIRSSIAGTLTVPREVVTTVQLGIRPRNVIYKGPSNLEGWRIEDNWHFEDDQLVSSGIGGISRTFKSMPDSFSLRFTLGWTRNLQTQIFFCSDDTRDGQESRERYILQIGASGMDLRRQSSDNSRNQALAGINRGPDSFPERKMDIEIRFDHRQRLISLLIDGELEGTYPDPLPERLPGKGISFRSNMPKGNGIQISNILVQEWDAAGERHRSEDRGNPAEDALIDHQGQRYGGRLVGTDKDGSILLFKSPHNPDALRIPADRVSTLFFRHQAAPGNPPAAAGDLVLDLAAGGRLAASRCIFKDSEVRMDHPLLGPLTLKRNAVRMLERRQADATGNEETQEETGP